MRRRPAPPIRRARLATVGAILFLASPALATEALYLVNGHWYDGSGFVRRDFYSVDGILRDVWDGRADTVDLGGAWVVPGYGNAHSHAIGNDDYRAESGQFLARGVLYVANPNSIASRANAAREAASAPETVDARFAHAGLTSSGGHPIQIFENAPGESRMAGDAYFAIDDEAALDKAWPSILATRPDFVKVYLERSELHAARRQDDTYYGKRGIDPALLPSIVARSHAAGLRVAAHVTSRYDFRIAVESGVDEIAHLPLETLETDDARLAAERGATLVTTALSHRPSVGVEDLDTLHRSNLSLLRAAGVSIVLGTDSQASVVDEVLKLHSLGALDPGELLHALVVDTPRWIFPERAIGRLEDGAEASFMVLEANPLQDLAALRKIDARYKSGHRIDLPEADAKKLPGIGQQLVHTLMARGTDAAIAEYHRLRTEEPDGWDFSEGQLNALGYAMIQHGKTAEAVAIFRLNCEQYPTSSNVWDSLGDAYVELGETAKAKESFQRALEIDPDNIGSKEKLQKLLAP